MTRHSRRIRIRTRVTTQKVILADSQATPAPCQIEWTTAEIVFADQPGLELEPDTDTISVAGPHRRVVVERVVRMGRD